MMKHRSSNVVSGCRGTRQQYEVTGCYPTRSFWDVNYARLLVCEVRRSVADDNPLQQDKVTATANQVASLSLLCLKQCRCFWN